jgi:hypothetical protein
MERDMSDEEQPANPDVLEITAAGKTWRLRSPGFAMRLDAEEEVRKQRRIEFKAAMLAIAEMPDGSRSHAIVMAFDNLAKNTAVTNFEASDWLIGPSGELFQITRALQAADSSVTSEQAREFLSAITVAQNEEIFRFLSGKLLGVA